MPGRGYYYRLKAFALGVAKFFLYSALARVPISRAQSDWHCERIFRRWQLTKTTKTFLNGLGESELTRYP